MHLVSCIIPTYNCRAYLKDAVDSVLSQSYSSVEIIIVDDGSTDGTGEYVGRQYGGKVIYLFQENRGLAGARNTGLSHVRGQFVVFLDADDVLLQEKMSRQVTFLQENADVDVVYNASRYFADGDTSHIFQYVTPGYSGDILERLIVGNFIPINSAMVRTDKVRAEMFDEDFRSLEDWDLWLRMSLKGSKFLFHDEVLSLVRIRKDNMTSNRKEMYRNMVCVLDKFILLLEKEGKDTALKGKGYLAHAVYELFAEERPSCVNSSLYDALKRDSKLLWPVLKVFIKNYLRFIPGVRNVARRSNKFHEIESFWGN